MTEFEVHSKDKDIVIMLWIIGILVVSLLTMTVACSENIKDVIRDVGIHIGTVLIVILLGVAALFIGRGRVERISLWKYT
ncbi:MAG: hypothetical protein QN229_01715 [Desulfurococcaceae archaeon TW002]